MSGVVASCAAIARVQPFEFTINGTGGPSYTNVRIAAVSAGWDGDAPVVCTLTGTFYYSGGYSPDAALVVAGAFPGGVKVVNQASIYGKPGAPGRGADQSNSPNPPSAGQPGGTALLATTSCIFDNQGTLAGGGGGGGGGGYGYDGLTPGTYWGGGGAGGGRGYGQNAGGKTVGGAGGYGSGGSGSPGTDASTSTPGSGGLGGGSGKGGTGGNGGGWGAAGTAGQNKWGNGAVGGRGGYAVEGNSYITWINTGIRTGGVV